MTHCNYCQLTQYGLIRFDGVDAAAFLQGQLTCNVQTMQPARGQYGGYCTPKGRLLASFLLWKDADAYFMMLPVALCEPIRKRLSMYILRSKVKAADVSAELALIGLAGAGAESIVAQLKNVAVIPLPHDRYVIAAPAANASTLNFSGAIQREPEFWNQLDIEAGVPVVVSATQEQFVPQTVNLDLIGAVSFDKGCYPGQEIVARAHYLGRVKQRMTLAHVAGDAAPCPGDKLYSPTYGEQASGMIVAAVPARDGGFDALAVVQTADLASPDVHLKSPDGPLLTLREPPYKLSLT